MRKRPSRWERRSVLAVLPLGLTALLTSCTIERWTQPPAEEDDGPVGPATAAEALELAEFAPAPDGVDAQLIERQPAGDFEQWACEVALTAPAEVIDPWLGQSYGDEGLPARAHVTTTQAKATFDIGDVPDTWLLEDVSLSGVPYERMVLIDDQDPRTVRVHLVEVQD